MKLSKELQLDTSIKGDYIKDTFKSFIGREFLETDKLLDYGLDSFAIMQICYILKDYGLTPQIVYEYETLEAIKLALKEKNQTIILPESYKPAVFARLLMGISYKSLSLVPYSLISKLIPLINQRFFLSHLHRVLVFENLIDTECFKKAWEKIKENQPIYSYQTELDQGKFTGHFKLNRKTHNNIFVTTETDLDKLRAKLKTQIM